MSKSTLVNEYNKANIKEKKIKTFFNNVDVSFLDVLNNNEIEVITKDYKDCLCKDSSNLKDYFVGCDKCNKKGIIKINEHEVVCNKCKGEKYIRIHDCYLCNNEGKLLLDDKIKLKLTDNYKNGDEIVLEYPEYKLVLKINIYDKDDYYVRGNDIYYLKSIKYSKDDYKLKKTKQVNTLNGKKEVRSEFKVKKEIVVLENEGLNGGDFYFIFENEVEEEKEVIYTNILLDDCGYVDINEVINKKIVVAKKAIALNSVNYLYVDDKVNEYEDDNYLIKFNKFNLNEFEINEDFYYVVNLEKEDLLNDKKSIVVGEEKFNINYKKNLKEVSYIDILNKGFVNKKGKKEGIKIKINPYFENVYKISIKDNKKTIYVEDYKYDDYRVVETFSKSDYLEDYIAINNEDRVVVNNDLVIIKRVK